MPKKNIRKMLFIGFISVLLLSFVLSLSATVDKPEKPKFNQINSLSGSIQKVETASLNSNTFVVGYQIEAGNLVFRVAQVSDNNVLYQAETVLDKFENDTNLVFFKLLALNDRQIVTLYRFASDSTTRFNLGNISDGKIIFSYDSKDYRTQLNSNEVREVSAVKLSGNTLAVVTSEIDSKDDKYKGYILVGEVIGNEIRFTRQQEFSILTCSEVPCNYLYGVQDPTITALSERSMIIGWEASSRDGTNAYLQYAEYYEGKIRFKTDKIKVFFNSAIESLTAASLGSNKFLLSMKTYTGAPSGSMVIHIFSGEYFENEIVIKDSAAAVSYFSTSVNLNVLGKNTFIFNYSTPQEPSKMFFKTGVLSKGELLFSDESAVEKIMYSLSFCKLSDYQFGFAFQGGKDQNGTIIGNVGKPVSPIITDGSPSLLKTVSFGNDKILAAYTETDKTSKTNHGWLRLGKAEGGKATFGTPAEFSKETVTALNLSSLDAERFALIYRSAGRTRLVIGKIQNNEVSIGQPVDVRGDELLADLQIVRIPNNKIVLGYRTESELNVLTVADVSSDIPRFSGEEILIDSVRKEIAFKQFSLANSGNKLIASYNYQYEDANGDYQDDYRLRSAFVDDTGKITLQNVVPTERFQDCDIKFLNDKKFAFAYRSHTEKNIGKIFTGETSDKNELTLGKTSIFSETGTRPISLAKIDENNSVLLYGTGTGSVAAPAEKVFGKVCRTTISEVSCGEPLLVFAGKVNLLSASFLTDKHIAFSFAEVEKGTAEAKIADVNTENKTLVVEHTKLKNRSKKNGLGTGNSSH
jgi:hypothetical protein